MVQETSEAEMSPCHPEPFGRLRSLEGRLREGSAVSSSRREFLRTLGIPGEPREQRLQALERLERYDLGRKVAARHGVAALPEPPPGMRGELVPGGETTGGAPLLGVLDRANRRLVVVPAPPDAGPLIGRRVTIALDVTGRPVIRPDGLGRER